MTYRVPIEDIKFNLEQLGLAKAVNDLAPFEEITPDVVDAVLQEHARFVEDVVAPLNCVGDTQPPHCQEGEVTLSPGFAEAVAQHGSDGWQGLQHSPEVGGQGFPKVVATAVAENLHAANMAFALCPMLTDGCIEAIQQAGTAEQQQRYIPPMVEGRWTGTMNLTEPQAGSDLSLLNSRAIPQPDGSYRLYGQKIFITWGEHDAAENIIHLVLARVPDAPEGVKGISLFVVPKFLIQDDGSLGPRNDVYCASLEHKLGIHGSPTAVLLFGENRGDVGEGAIAYRIGEENDGLRHMFVMMNESRFEVGIQGVSVSERALQQAWRYAQERLQGRAIEGNSRHTVSINEHPDIQRLLMTMRSLTEGARAMCLYTAHCADLANYHPDDATRQHYQAAYDYMVPIVKGFCTEMSVEVASLGVQVHGGMGYIEETGAAQYFRDARILPIYEGTTAIQANDLLGRKTFGDKGAMAFYFVQQCRDTAQELVQQGDTSLTFIAQQLSHCADDYEATVRHMLTLGENKAKRQAFLSSVNYLMQAGYVHLMWHSARAALAAHSLRNHSEHVQFAEQKIATALFYATQVASRSSALHQSIKASEQANQALSAIDFNAS